MSVRKVADVVGVSHMTVYRIIRNGEFDGCC